MTYTLFILFSLLTLVVLPNDGLAEEIPISPRDIKTEVKPLAGVLPNEKQFEDLGGLLLSLRKSSLVEDTEVTNEEFLRVQKQLLENPGYAVHYGFQIRKLRTEALASPEKYPLYEAYAVRAFGILELLPSVETVAIVSTFLDDSWNPPLASDAGSPSKNAQRILRLLLQDPPETERPFDVPAWLNWQEAVKAGERTFKLKVSDAEFNFTGPVEKK